MGSDVIACNYKLSFAQTQMTNIYVIGPQCWE